VVGGVTTTYFHTDADLSGAGQFDDGGTELAIASEFTLPDGTYVFRWRHPSTVPSVTPVVRVWNEANVLVLGPLAFTALAVDSWCETAQATLPAGTYRVAVNTTHYVARTGFYAGGPVTRGTVTGTRGVFGASPTSAPGGTSTASYLVDVGTVTADPEPEPEPEVPLEAVADDPAVGAMLHLARVMDEVALALQTIPGLKTVFAYPPPTLTAPAGYVTYPERMAYHQSYQRGTADIIGLPIVLVVGKPTDRRVRDRIALWSAPDGPGSVIAALEDWEWKSCDDVTVMGAEFDIETIADVPYMAVIFTADAVGPGRE
jgi:hypothetical protein